ncbi:MAG TPA: YraN family protein [Magnetospirillaceae bacterium]|jgi:putative endonuclease
MKRPASTAAVRPGRHERGKRARKLGKWAELLCVASLTLRGWRILDRSAALSRGTGVGEIDIVARRGATLAFIEVKARPSLDDAAAAISTHQQERLIRAAEAYLARNPALQRCAPRFDAMLVVPRRLPRHVRDAWRVAG